VRGAAWRYEAACEARASTCYLLLLLTYVPTQRLREGPLEKAQSTLMLAPMSAAPA